MARRHHQERAFEIFSASQEGKSFDAPTLPGFIAITAALRGHILYYIYRRLIDFKPISPHQLHFTIYCFD